MHNPASVLENDTHKLQRDFDIQMDHLISARRPDIKVIKKKKGEPCPPGWLQNKIEKKSKIGWGCRIHRLNLCKSSDSPKERAGIWY